MNKELKIASLLCLSLLFLLVSCTQNKFEGEFNIEAEVSTMGNTMVSVKYKLGNSMVYDDLPMKDKNAILSEWKNENMEVIPLKVTITGNNNDAGHTEGILKYYYRSNFICESKSFDFQSLLMLANDNAEMFLWEYRDGKAISKREQEEVKEEVKKATPTRKVEVGKGETL